MAKTGKQAPKESVGTPTAIILSVLSGIVIYGVEEIKASMALADEFPLRSVLIASIGLGLALCFFWRRLPQNVFRTLSAGIYLFGVWTTMILATVAPLMLAGEWMGPRVILFQQMGLGAMALSAICLMTGFLGQQKPQPAVTATGVGSLLLVCVSVLGYFKPAGTQGVEEVITAHKKTGETSLAAHAVGERDVEHEQGQEHESDREPEAEPETSAQHIQDAEGTEDRHGSKHGKEHGGSHKAAKPVASLHGMTPEKHGKAAKTKVAMKLSAQSLHGDEEDGHKLLEKTYAKQKHAKAAMDDRQEEDEHGSLAPKMPDKKAAKSMNKNTGKNLCETGSEQSPIDIPASWPLKDDIKLNYRLSTASIVDNGQTIQLTPGPGNTAEIAGQSFQLMQIRFHSPSEHQVAGRSHELEIQFEHKDAAGHVAIIGVMVQKGDASKSFDEIWSFVPQSFNNPLTPKGQLFNLLALMPSKLKAYRYKGSLTYSPCSENVLWSVLSNPINMSESQIRTFQGRYNNNARPIQLRASESAAH